MRVCISVNASDDLVIEGFGAGARGTVTAPAADVIAALFAALEIHLAASRDGAVALQFDAAPESAIAALVDCGVVEIKSIDGLVKEALDGVAAEPDIDDGTNLSLLRQRLSEALGAVDAAILARQATD